MGHGAIGLHLIAVDPGRTLEIFREEARRPRRQETLIFNLIESPPGRPYIHTDSTAVLELVGLPFTGSSPAAHALTTDKIATRALLASEGVAVAPGGRLDLGVGTGWNDFEHEALGIPFPDPAERWERLVECLDYLAAAFGAGHGRYQGRHYRLDLDVRPKPTGIKLIVGGSGRTQTPTLAGTMADEYNLFICPVDEARAKVEVMRAAAGGRPVEATMMGQVRMAGTDAELAEMLQRAATRRNTTVEAVVRHWDEAGVVFGTPAQVAERLAALEEAGISRLYLQWLDLGDYEGMARMLDLVPR